MKSSAHLKRGLFFFSAVASTTLGLCTTAFGAGFDVPRDLMATAQKIEALADSAEISTPQACLVKLMAMNTALYQLKVVSKETTDGGQHFKFVPYFTQENGLTAADAAQGKDVLNTLFRARTKLHSRFQKMIASDAFKTKAELERCTKAMKITHRTLRGVEDYWGMMALQRAGKLNDSKATQDVQNSALQKSEWPMTLVNPAVAKTFTASDIQSGDLVMSLDSAFTAAVIGRINSVDSQFSHLAMVYVDDGSVFGTKGKAYVIEAEPDTGVRIVAFDEYLKHGNIRVAVYRLTNIKKDANSTPASDVAKHAAKYIVELAKSKHIAYNFAMDMKDESKLFCSQEVSVAFNNACLNSKCEDFSSYQNLLGQAQSSGPFPFVMSKFDLEGNSIVRMLELKVDETFAPGDVEMDPRLTLVAEWRNHAALRTPRYFNMTLSKIMQWMEQRNYEMMDIPEIKVLAMAGEKIVKETEKMPPDMPRGFVEGTALVGFMMEGTLPLGDNDQKIQAAINAMSPQQIESYLANAGLDLPQVQALGLGVTADKLKAILIRITRNVGFTNRLANLEDANVKATGYLLTDSQMDTALDTVMARDCEAFKKGEPVMYHDIMRRKTDDRAKACDTTVRSLKGFW